MNKKESKKEVRKKKKEVIKENSNKKNKNKKIDWNKKILAYSLENAIEHEGKAREGSVLNGLFHEGLGRDKVKEIMPMIKEVVNEVNKLGIKEQELKFKEVEEEVSHRKEREGLPDLPDVKKNKVIMRFAPSPSGPLHIGHALTGMPSALYVREYGGTFYIRIEDTNPKNIAVEAYKMIPEEAKWLFGKIKVVIQSDRIKTYYRYAEKLIKLNKAYVCDCNPDKFKELIEKRKGCSCRVYPKEEQMKRWKKMFKGYKKGEAVLRFKSDLSLNNPALIDFPLARIQTDKHPRQGKKYRVWPLMNLAVSVDDIEEGMTHAIRAKDHRDNAKRQEMIFSVLGKKPPVTFFLGRYKFKDMKISSSNTRMLIEKRKFSGWDDIRLPFIASLKKRGFQPQAFEMMAIQRGLSEVDKVIEKKDLFEVLSNFNKEVLGKVKKKEFLNKKRGWYKEVKVLMDTGKIVKGYVDVDDLKENEVIYLDSIGYVRVNKLSKDKKDIEFWFAHK